MVRVVDSVAVGSAPIDRQYPDHLDARLLRIAGVCVLASVMAILDATVVSVAQLRFQEVFGADQAIVAWTMTGYTLALATVIPATGWAADRFGTKRLFIGSLVFFTVGSLLCAFAPSIGALVAFRVIQGLGGGMLMPLTFTILTREAGPKRLGRLMAVLGVPMLLGPISGPILGGWLIDAFSWEWIFLINLPIGAVAIVLAAVVFPPDNPVRSESFDFVGMLLLSPGLAALLFGVSSVPGRGTVADPWVWVPATVGAALIVAFVVHALRRSTHPLIDLRLFGNRGLRVANITMFLFAVSFFGSMLLLPLYFQQVLGQNALQSGLSLIPQGLGAVLTMPIAGALMDRRGPARVVLVGITLITAGMATFAYGVAEQLPYNPVLLGGLLVMGMGMGATMMPVSGAAVATLTRQQVARGSTLINVNQQVAGSIGTALMSVIFAQQLTGSAEMADAGRLAGTVAAVERGQLPPTALPPPDIVEQVLTAGRDAVSHAFFVVFAVAVGFVAATVIPAWFLPRRAPADTPTPVLMH